MEQACTGVAVAVLRSAGSCCWTRLAWLEAKRGAASPYSCALSLRLRMRAAMHDAGAPNHGVLHGWRSETSVREFGQRRGHAGWFRSQFWVMACAKPVDTPLDSPNQLVRKCNRALCPDIGATPCDESTSAQCSPERALSRTTTGQPCGPSLCHHPPVVLLATLAASCSCQPITFDQAWVRHAGGVAAATGHSLGPNCQPDAPCADAVGIFSHAYLTERRTCIRQTWLSPGLRTPPGLSFVFVLGLRTLNPWCGRRPTGWWSPW